MASKPISRDDVVRLLGLVQVYDSRTVSQADVEAWYQALGFGLEDCRAAVIFHFANDDSGHRLMPARVNVLARGIAHRRASSMFAPCGCPKADAAADHPHHRPATPESAAQWARVCRLGTAKMDPEQAVQYNGVIDMMLGNRQ